MLDAFIAVVVKVPDEYFHDDDDICLAAGNFVCGRLESHLIARGHTIPKWILGGCEEDWGVYFESQYKEEIFEYHITFFPSLPNEIQCQLAIQYHLKFPLLKRIFKIPGQLTNEHHLHKTMQELGKTFSQSRMLRKSQFDREI
jgi:hypothetical protein